MSEHQEQCILVQWCRMQGGCLRDARKIFAIPNGGRRDARTGARMRLEGVKRGVPDLLLPIARKGRHGLFIELKTATGRTTPEQREMIEQLRADGYAVEVCHGWEQARLAVEDYLS
jgi:hypothetical protein